MYIIAGQEKAERLKENYTVLELETFNYQGKEVPTFCVIDAESMPVLELPTLEHYKKLHSDFVAEYRLGNYKFCLDLVEHLKGKFGGQVDSFYETLIERISGQ